MLGRSLFRLSSMFAMSAVLCAACDTGSSKGGEDDSPAETQDTEPSECDRFADGFQDKLISCDLEVMEDPGGEDPEVECTDELLALMVCQQGCLEVAPCGALDASDIDAAMEYADCIADCVENPGQPEGPYGDYPLIYGMFQSAGFVYDAETDSVITGEDEFGDPLEPLVQFILTDEAYWKGEAGGVQCALVFAIDAPIPRASWATGTILFGFEVEIDENSRFFDRDCMDVFGEEQIWDFFDDELQDIWTFGLHADVHEDAEDALSAFDVDDDDAIGSGTYFDDEYSPTGIATGIASVDGAIDTRDDIMSRTEMLTPTGLSTAYYNWLTLYGWVFEP